jgi:hypothetical protein
MSFSIPDLIAMRSVYQYVIQPKARFQMISPKRQKRARGAFFGTAEIDV